MNAAVLSSRDPFMPQPVQRTGPALALAVLAHLLLIIALAFGVNWHDSEPTTVAAELWSAVPQVAAPRAVEAPTPPPQPHPRPAEVRKPEPVVAPKPPAPALPDPQIAIEKAKREEAKRQAEADEKARQQKLATEKREQEELAKKKAAADKLAKEKAETEKAEKLAKEKAEKAEKVEAARQAALREAYLKRMAGLAGATGGPTDSGSALQSSGPSAGYAGRIVARIRPNIVYTDSVSGNPRAVVEIRLAPDGTIVDKTLKQSSGSKSWDEAVLRAIDRTGTLPRDIDGRVRTPIVIGFKPND